jgi:tripartite-type tricarboxylate transporter receptor subunit TctC
LIRHAARSLVMLCALAAAPALAADPWPVRPVTVICPFPPGISTDILVRAVSAALSEALGQQFVVENKPGASGSIGGLAAAKAASDGYTLFLGTLGPTVTNKFLYKNIGYDPDRAFSPVAMMGASPLIIVGSPKLPAANFAEMIDYAKKNPGKLNAGTVGAGSQAHITVELINKLAGISIVHVPYRIATQALPDLIFRRSPGRLQLHPDLRAGRAERDHPRACRHDTGAPERPAAGADGERIRISGLRGERVERTVCAGGNAA